MKKIPLTGKYGIGKFAFVDDDFEYLNQLRWYVDIGGYAVRRNNGKYVRMHRIINETPDNFTTDHIDGNKLNNQRSNLRNATIVQNGFNKKKYTGKSLYKGVCWHKGDKKWRATIGYNKRRVHIGYYKTQDDAAAAYNIAAVNHYGEFAHINIIKGRSKCQHGHSGQDLPSTLETPAILREEKK